MAFPGFMPLLLFLRSRVGMTYGKQWQDSHVQGPPPSRNYRHPGRKVIERKF
jgi:hypothetical protein